jgi:sulfate/thiosulfate transport system ATP-binding protein
MSVVVRHLTKRFGRAGTAAACDEVTFEALSGKITSLLGPSGSGKSTILRLIAGLEEPDAGTIGIEGVDVTATSPRTRGVGFVFQSYALFGHMSVWDNVAFGMRVRGTPKAEVEARVRELLALIQLEDYRLRLPAQLSGGQRQRVALARALAPRPKVLLLDEPFGALDAQVRVELREWLSKLHQETKVTTILVTHDQEEALELSEHVVLLRNGRVEQAGSPHDLYDQPATSFVASFLGGTNVLRGNVRDGRAQLGNVALDAPTGSTDGAGVSAFIRPADIRIGLAREDTPDVALAKLERLTRVGGHVKLALRLPSGEVMTVQMIKSELDALGVVAGDRVLVDLCAAKVFLEDYSI